MVLGLSKLLLCSPFFVQAASLANLILNSINQKRKENNLPMLKSIPNLENAAKDQALYMCENSILTHENPNGDLQMRTKRNNFQGNEIGENIAKNHNDNYEEVVGMWLKSPPHRKNIFKDYAYTGMATCLDKKGSRYWVQVFGKDGAGKESDKLDDKNKEETSENKETDDKYPGNIDQEKDDVVPQKPKKTSEQPSKSSKPKNNKVTKKSPMEISDDAVGVQNEYSDEAPELSDEMNRPVNQSRNRRKRSVDNKAKTPVTSNSFNLADLESKISKLLDRNQLQESIKTTMHSSIPEMTVMSTMPSVISTQIIYIVSTTTEKTSSSSSQVTYSSSSIPETSYKHTEFPKTFTPEVLKSISVSYLIETVTVTQSSVSSSMPEHFVTVTKTRTVPETHVSVFTKTEETGMLEPETSTVTLTKTVEITKEHPVKTMFNNNVNKKSKNKNKKVNNSDDLQDYVIPKTANKRGRKKSNKTKSVKQVPTIKSVQNGYSDEDESDITNNEKFTKPESATESSDEQSDNNFKIPEKTIENLDDKNTEDENESTEEPIEPKKHKLNKKINKEKGGNNTKKKSKAKKEKVLNIDNIPNTTIPLEKLLANSNFGFSFNIKPRVDEKKKKNKNGNNS